jgi:hypothetical protein
VLLLIVNPEAVVGSSESSFVVNSQGIPMPLPSTADEVVPRAVYPPVPRDYSGDLSSISSQDQFTGNVILRYKGMEWTFNKSERSVLRRSLDASGIGETVYIESGNEYMLCPQIFNNVLISHMCLSTSTNMKLFSLQAIIYSIENGWTESIHFCIESFYPVIPEDADTVLRIVHKCVEIGQKSAPPGSILYTTSGIFASISRVQYLEELNKSIMGKIEAAGIVSRQLMDEPGTYSRYYLGCLYDLDSMNYGLCEIF